MKYVLCGILTSRDIIVSTQLPGLIFGAELFGNTTNRHLLDHYQVSFVEVSLVGAMAGCVVGFLLAALVVTNALISSHAVSMPDSKLRSSKSHLNNEKHLLENR